MTYQSAERLFADRVQIAAASDDGRWIFAGTRSGELVKLVTDGTTAWRIAGVESPMAQVVANHDGTRVTVLGGGGAAKILDESGCTVLNLPKVAKLGKYNKNGRQTHLSQNRELLSVSAQGAVNSETSRRGNTGRWANAAQLFRAIVAQLRPRPAAEAYLRLRTLPGEQGQVEAMSAWVPWVVRVEVDTWVSM